jgi:hypothetical protein
MTSPQLTEYAMVKKAESFSSKIKKKTKMPALVSYIQHSAGNPSHSH